MDWITIALAAGLAVMIGVAIVMAIMIRGAFRTQESSGVIESLTGREIESIRRRLASVGMSGVSLAEIFSLIRTLRDIQLGIYKDEDPYVPADPYEDVDKPIYE